MIHQDTSYKYLFLFVFFFPFMGLLLSLYYWQKSWAKNVFWFACMYMAFVHIYIPDGSVLGEGVDIGRYVAQFQEAHNMSLTFNEICNSNVSRDFYQAVMTYLVSRFSGEGHVLYLFFGIIYGFFYSRNMWFLLERLPKCFSKWLYLLIAVYFLICPIWNIGGVRMWTALHVFCYGALPYLWDRDHSRLWWSILSIFIHFSFIMPVCVLLGYCILPNRIKIGQLFLNIVMSLYLLTFITNMLDVNQIGAFLQTMAPNLFEDRVAGYFGEEYVGKIAEHIGSHSFFYKVSTYVNQYVILYFAIIAFLRIRKIKDRAASKVKRLFSFALFLYALANMLAIVPSGGRFIYVAQMFLLPAILFSLTNFSYRYNGLTKIVLLSSSVWLLFVIRAGAECYGINLLIGNFITALPLETNVSFIKMLLYII
ncbi:hypothetical protein [Butyricimonas virosa]|uniref:hypothetical protein n=1 Tax=Butyricimonas virosa TaxID=544645 RepID=UPI0039F457FE